MLRPVPPDEACVDPQPPGWRVFDTPATPGAESSAAEAAGSVPPLPFALRTPAMLGIGAAVVLAIAAVAVATGGLPPAGDASSSGLESDAPAASGIAAVDGALVVDVAGAVARPGVYHLASGSRVADAIAAAGGLGPRVDAGGVAAQLNLAAVVHDGDRIIVPSRDDPVTTAGAPAGSKAPTLIDLNHASAEELDSLPGIGPVTADKIIAARAEAPFRTVEELRTRGLVGQKTFDQLKTLVTVG